MVVFTLSPPLMAISPLISRTDNKNADIITMIHIADIIIGDTRKRGRGHIPQLTSVVTQKKLPDKEVIK